MSPISRRRPASIRDVAERAGVSLGSASRVINGAPEVTPDVRERVLAAVEELGYRPNPAAQSLRLSSTRTIGCMLTDVTNPLYGNLFHAMEERLRTAGYLVLLANSLYRVDREIDILSTFRDRRMDGVIMAPGNERDPGLLRAFTTLDRPTVIIDRDMLPQCDRLQFDHVPGMRAVTSHLAGLGHRRIALVLSQTNTRPIRRRIEGFHAGLADHGISPEEAMVVRLPSSMSSSYSAVVALLGLDKPPTALIAMGTNILSEALNAIATHGLRIPQDISVVSLGDTDFARSFRPPITALRVNLEEAADHAVSMLLDRLEGRSQGPGRTVKQGLELIRRESSAAPHGPRVKVVA